MKTPEELNTLKNEVETLNKKLHELTDEELTQVSGGEKFIPIVFNSGEDQYPPMARTSLIIPHFKYHMKKRRSIMKSPEELNALKEEAEALNKKPHELTDEELEQVTGGVVPPTCLRPLSPRYGSLFLE